jgi:hypothetical protein
MICRVGARPTIILTGKDFVNRPANIMSKRLEYSMNTFDQWNDALFIEIKRVGVTKKVPKCQVSFQFLSG